MAPRKRANPVVKLAAPANPGAGQRLVEELSKPDDPYSLTFLIEQAGHTADYLERLRGLLSGDRAAWMHVRVGRGQVLEVKIDNALMEARQQTTVLRHLLAEILRRRAAIPMGDDDDVVADL